MEFPEPTAWNGDPIDDPYTPRDVCTQCERRKAEVEYHANGRHESLCLPCFDAIEPPTEGSD